MTVIIYSEAATAIAKASYRKRFAVAIKNYQTGEGWYWEYPMDQIKRYHAKTMLIALALNPVADCVPYRKIAPFAPHPFIYVDPVTHRASVTQAGRAMMGEIVRRGVNRIDWSSLRTGDLINCSGSYLAQRVMRHKNIVTTVTPTGEGWAWKHPAEIDRLTAKAMLIVKVYEPEVERGMFYAPHRIRDHGTSRIFSGVVAPGHAVLGSDGRVRLTDSGKGFFRCSSTSPAT